LTNGNCFAVCETATDPDGDGWSSEGTEACIMPSNPLATDSPWCRTPVPRVPYEAQPAVVSSATTGVADIPRPARVDAGPPVGCPHDDQALVAFDPAWLSDAGVIDIPPDTRALLSGNDEIPAGTLVRRLHIPATSELVFDDQDTTLRVTDVVVDGALRLGAETCRLSSGIDFVFDTDENVADVGVRDAIYARQGLGLAVSATGTLEVFGALHQPTWTRLGATAAAGSSQVTLSEPVDWLPGQQVVLVTSARRDWPFLDENEVRTIVNVTGGDTLELDTALTYGHYGGAEYQVEVGLLSRNIVFRTAGEILDATSTFGGHILSGSPRTRVSGVELYGLGQQNRLGRYPFHLHHAGAAAGAFFSDSSVWRSNWRCAVIHRTDDALLSKNVAYDTFGHCYYLEDGVELGNEISFNLAAGIKIMGPVDQASLDALAEWNQAGFVELASPALTQPADRAAAGFYIPNGDNDLIGNAASGGFAGYSFPNLPEAVGGSEERIWPLRYAISHFDGNTAHSAGYFWPVSGCVYVGGVLEVVDDNGTDKLRYSSGRPFGWNRLRQGTDTFNNTKTFLCETGITHWGIYPRVINVESWDTGLLANLFQSASIEGALAVGVTGNSPNLSYRPHSWFQRGFRFYDTDTQTILDGVVFRGFHAENPSAMQRDQDNCALTTTSHSDQFTPQRMSATANFFFDDVDESQRFCHPDSGTLSSRNFNFHDTDGSATAFAGDGLPAGARIVGSGHSDVWQLSPQCVYQDDWGLWLCPDDGGTQDVAAIAVSPNNDVVVEMYGLMGTSLATTWYSSTDYIDAQITGPSEVGWHHDFPGGVPDAFDVLALQVPDDSFSILSLSLPPGVTCSVDDDAWTEVGDYQALLGATGAVYATEYDTCFVKVPPTDVGDFSRAGMSVPNQTWRGNPTATTYFTVTTGCSSGIAACATLTSSLPAIP
jgi:hypothetical protein